MDGTFSVAPRTFYQLYIVHGIILGKAFPLVYILLTRKLELIYTRAFSALAQNAFNKYAIDLRPRFIIADFELAALNAMRTSFPGVEVRGCHFHFAQSIQREVGKLGLKTEYDSRGRFHYSVRLLYALAYVPVGLVEEYYRAAVNCFDGDKEGELLKYFEARNTHSCFILIYVLLREYYSYCI